MSALAVLAPEPRRLAAALALACALTAPVPARSQGTKPLRKSDLVRLLGTRALAKRDVAALVRRNCVTFHPTARDRADLRLAGADTVVFAAIDECLRARAAAAQAAPAPAAPRRSPLRVETSTPVNALAGTDAEVVVLLFRETVPQAGVALVLRGASAIPGGLAQDPVALTNQRGAATFRVPAGTTPGTYSLTLALKNGTPLPGEIMFVTTQARAEAPAPPRVPPPPPPPPPPAPPPVPAVQFTQFTSGAGQHGAPGAALAQPLLLQVRDQMGKPLAGEAVSFAITSGVVTPRAATSDSTGAIAVRVTLSEHAGPVVITANVGRFIRTATVYTDPGPPHELVVEQGDVPVLGGVPVRSRDTVTLRVVAHDAYGNRTALDDFSARTSGRAIALRSAEARDSVGVVKLEPRRNGAADLDVTGSGLRTRVAVDVALPAAPAGPWAIGVRAGAQGVNDPWLAVANLTGISGPDASVYGRRTLSGGFSVALGAGVGSLSLDRSTGGTVSATLLEGYARVEWAVVPRGPVSPVVSLGGGGYRVKSSDDGQTLYHTNVFWSGGAGVDVALSATVTAEARFERQWLTDSGVGHVGTLWPLSAGLRIAL